MQSRLREDELTLTRTSQGAIPFLSVCPTPGRHRISILKILFHFDDKLIKKITIAVKRLLRCILQFPFVQFSRRRARL